MFFSFRCRFLIGLIIGFIKLSNCAIGEQTMIRSSETLKSSLNIMTKKFKNIKEIFDKHIPELLLDDDMPFMPGFPFIQGIPLEAKMLFVPGGMPGEPVKKLDTDFNFENESDTNINRRNMRRELSIIGISDLVSALPEFRYNELKDQFIMNLKIKK